MFSLWCSINSAVINEERILEEIDSKKSTILSTISKFESERKTVDNDFKNIKSIKENERKLLRAICKFQNLDEDSVYRTYKSYIDSNFNALKVSDEVLEKINSQEFIDAHFRRMLEFHHREILSLLNCFIFFLSKNNKTKFQKLQTEFFKDVNLTDLLSKCLENYVCISRNTLNHLIKPPAIEISISDNLQTKLITQNFKELEKLLEVVFLLVNELQINYQEFVKVISKLKLCNISRCFSINNLMNQTAIKHLVSQICYLKSLIFIKMCMFNKESLSNDQKSTLLRPDGVKELINEFIDTFPSTKSASPVLLAWSALLYKMDFSNSTMENDAKQLINRLFVLSSKEDIFTYLLEMFELNIFNCEDTLLYVKNSVYDFINNIFGLFDESSFNNNVNVFYELCYKCLEENEELCEQFWSECKREERDNITLLLYNSIEIFPFHIEKTLRFFSLIAGSNKKLCEEVIIYLLNMDQYCESSNVISAEQYRVSENSIKLIQKRCLFDGYELPIGYEGKILLSTNRLAANEEIVVWKLKFNVFTLIKSYTQRILQLIDKEERLNNDHFKIIQAIIGLINSIMKHFFKIEELAIYIRYIEDSVKYCFQLFSTILNKTNLQYSVLLSILFELLSKLPGDVSDKILKLLNENKLITASDSISDNQMSMDDFLKNKYYSIDEYNQLLIYKSENVELINNYVNLINRMIKLNGSSNQYIPMITCLFGYIFPQVMHVWKLPSIKSRLKLISSSLRLFHTALNTREKQLSQKDDKLVRLDKICHNFLLKTECSESILHLIRISFDSSEDSNFLNDIKILDEILVLSVSLINRLLSVSNRLEIDDILNSNLFLLITKSLNNYCILRDNSSNSLNYVSSANDSKDTTYSSFINIESKELFLDDTKMNSLNNLIDDSKTMKNWFFVILKLLIYKKNRVLDSLIFSLCKNISQLTPRLFGSLFINQLELDLFHKTILLKLKEKSSQVIYSICEFLCALVDQQPGFFQLLADLKFENDSKFKEGENSIFKVIFELIEFNNKQRSIDGDYYTVIAGFYSLFYSIWINKKYNYITYCKQKNNFWQNIISTLVLMKEECSNSYDSNLVEINKASYNESLIEPKIKCASLAFNIISIELFESLVQDKFANDFSNIIHNIFQQSLVEKWLQIHTQLLKNDLSFNLKKHKFKNYDDNYDNQEFEISEDDEFNNIFQSKTIFMALKTILLVLNKIEKPEFNLTQINLNTILENLIDSQKNIITYIQDKINTQCLVEQQRSDSLNRHFHDISITLLILLKSTNEKTVLTNLNGMIENLIENFEALISEEFTYLPTIISCLEASILHLFELTEPSKVIIKCNQLLSRLLICIFKVINASTSLSGKKITQDHMNVLIINFNLLRVFMRKENEQFWIAQFNNSCIMQSLYSLFQIFMNEYDSASIIHSIIDIFYRLATIVPDTLLTSGLMSNTCLTMGKVFEFIIIDNKNNNNKQQKEPKQLNLNKSWSGVLQLYLSVQTTLLNSLKYNFLPQSIIFFGSYYETMVQIIYQLQNFDDCDLLEIISHMCRYISEITKYKKETTMEINQPINEIPKLFTDLLQLCITRLTMSRLRCLKKLEDSNIVAANDLSDELIKKDNMFLLIIYHCLEILRNYIPDLSNIKYLSHLNEYNLLLVLNFTPPSFDTYTGLSFGSVLCMIDESLKMMHKYESNSKNLKRVQDVSEQTKSIQSPKKTCEINELDKKFHSKQLVTCILENSLYLLVTQTILYLNNSNYSNREKKLFKRELSSEMSSIMQDVNRTYKRTTSQLGQLKSPVINLNSDNSSKPNDAFFNFIESLLNSILQ